MKNVIIFVRNGENLRAHNFKKKKNPFSSLLSSVFFLFPLSGFSSCVTTTRKRKEEERDSDEKKTSRQEGIMRRRWIRQITKIDNEKYK